MDLQSELLTRFLHREVESIFSPYKEKETKK